jgi:aspartate/tyrosine/aromatic aminotransferase
METKIVWCKCFVVELELKRALDEARSQLEEQKRQMHSQAESTGASKRAQAELLSLRTQIDRERAQAGAELTHVRALMQQQLADKQNAVQALQHEYSVGFNFC